MNLDSPDTWRWLWFVGALIFLFGELFTPATFFFLPFAIGAGVASLLAFGGVNLTLEWLAFLLLSGAAFAGLWPLGRRMERADEQDGVGATRWVGQEARVVTDITVDGAGIVRLEREEWRAESLTGQTIRAGSVVVVTRISGTRLVVVPVDEPFDALPDLHQPDFHQPDLPHSNPSSNPSSDATTRRPQSDTGSEPS